MVEKLVTFVFAFMATNVDDIFLLTLWYAARRHTGAQIVGGQLLGIGALVLASMALALVGTVVGPRYIELMGLVPVYLGIRRGVDLWRNGSAGEKPTDPGGGSASAVAIALVTIANGGDNIGVYVPLLSTLGVAGKIQLGLVFFFMVLLWCRLAAYLAAHPLLQETLGRYANRVVPVVLVALGILILAESRAFTLFVSW